MKSVTLFEKVTVGFAVGAIVWVGLTTQAKADLVFDEESTEAVVTDRQETREALGAAQKAQVTQQSQIVTTPAVQQAAPVIVTQPIQSSVATVAAPQAEAAGVEHLSAAELMRRERMRAELQNEDILQTRLEELRLRDEKRRTDELVMQAAAATRADQAVSAQPAAPVETQVVQPPVTEVPPTAAMATGQTMVMQEEMKIDATEEENDSLAISVQGRGGIGGFMSSNGIDVSPRFSAGVQLSAEVTDNLSVDSSYSYSEYGIQRGYPAPGSTYNPWAYGTQDYDTMVLKQNVFDLGLRMHLLGRDSRFRPFLGGGGAYAKSFLNFNNENAAPHYVQNFNGPDYENNSFMGYLSTGFDLRISKNISVGAMFKYYAVLTSRMSQSSVGNGFYGYNYLLEQEKQFVGSSLNRSGFYSVLAGVTFTF